MGCVGDQTDSCGYDVKPEDLLLPRRDWRLLRAMLHRGDECGLTLAGFTLLRLTGLARQRGVLAGQAACADQLHRGLYGAG